jgi:hypothetical protein
MALYTTDGVLLVEDDDGGPEMFSSLLEVTFDGTSPVTLGLRAFPGTSGTGTLSASRIDPWDEP